MATGKRVGYIRVSAGSQYERQFEVIKLDKTFTDKHPAKMCIAER